MVHILIKIFILTFSLMITKSKLLTVVVYCWILLFVSYY